ncbi:glutaconyl-CoA decarboxylase subunit gamma-like [Argiope bruennichi]|uniref:Uncharacterized protein n=1 Tax=Argiope bruennichi TaxID=94029 RepID=A0A8T0FEY3_ARGBR|nr:glutaconyl-CoA decarboxylase subunit gamma-like [Argiope bruennichi]KAF8788872.1 hypothetical protein HNY73_006866 [Argiope bruennichi]
MAKFASLALLAVFLGVCSAASFGGVKDFAGNYYDFTTGQYSSALTGKVYNTAPIAYVPPAVAPVVAAPAVAPVVPAPAVIPAAAPLIAPGALPASYVASAPFYPPFYGAAAYVAPVWKK